MAATSWLSEHVERVRREPGFSVAGFRTGRTWGRGQGEYKDRFTLRVPVVAGIEDFSVAIMVVFDLERPNFPPDVVVRDLELGHSGIMSAKCVCERIEKFWDCKDVDSLVNIGKAVLDGQQGAIIAYLKKNGNEVLKENLKVLTTNPTVRFFLDPSEVKIFLPLELCKFKANISALPSDIQRSLEGLHLVVRSPRSPGGKPKFELFPKTKEVKKMVRLKPIPYNPRKLFTEYRDEIRRRILNGLKLLGDSKQLRKDLVRDLIKELGSPSGFYEEETYSKLCFWGHSKDGNIRVSSDICILRDYPKVQPKVNMVVLVWGQPRIHKILLKPRDEDAKSVTSDDCRRIVEAVRSRCKYYQRTRRKP